MIYTHDTGAPLTKEQWDFNMQQLALRLGEPTAVVLRSDRASPLTNRDVNRNFQNLLDLVDGDASIVLRGASPLEAYQVDGNFASLDAAVNRKFYGAGPYPVMDTVFAGARFLDPRFTFSRPDDRWEIVSGVLTRFEPNEPVLLPGGWSVRPSEANQWRHSQGFTSSPWTTNGSATISVRADLPGPDQGGSPSHTFIPSVSGSFRQVLQNTINTEAGKYYTEFWIVKPFGYNFIQLLGSFAGWGGFYVNFDLRDGAIVKQVPSAALKDCGSIPMKDGWWLVWATAQAVSTASGVALSMSVIDDGNRARGEAWTADGSSGVLLFAAQHNEGNLIPYIPTTTGAKTRAADIAKIQGAALDGVWNPTQGAVMFEADCEYTTVGNPFPKLLTLTTDQSADGMVFYRAVDNSLRFFATDSAGRYEPDKVIPGSYQSRNRIVLGWGDGVMDLFANGAKVRPGMRTPNGAALRLALSETYSSFAINRYQRLRIFDERPTDAQMQEWTS